jgi:hypothetical protein
MYVNNLVSIGSTCKTRFQIDRFLKAIDPGRRPTTYFFDGLMGGNIKGVINIIERDFVLRPGDICVVERAGKFIPCDRLSGFVFLHDFGTKDACWSSRAECESALAAAFDLSMAKYTYLGKKTADFLAGDPAICVVYYGACGLDDFANLLSVLLRKFGKEFTIVNVLNGKPMPVTRNGAVLTVFVDDDNSPKFGTSREWEGDDGSWDAALGALY